MTQAILECRGLSKRYAKHAPAALNDITLSLPKGRIIGLLGPNGSGKTTLIKIACGLLTPSGGALSIGGVVPGPATKRVVSYLPEHNSLPRWMKVGDALRYFQDFYENFEPTRAKDMLARLKIEENMALKSMSKGTLEKLQLILAMSRNADLYLLDEPIGGVDPAARDYILETIIQNYSENATVLISTHLIADIEKVLDEVVFLNAGNVSLVSSVDHIREEQGKSVDALFREVFKC